MGAGQQRRFLCCPDSDSRVDLVGDFIYGANCRAEATPAVAQIARGAGPAPPPVRVGKHKARIILLPYMDVTARPRRPEEDRLGVSQVQVPWSRTSTEGC